MRGRWQVMEQKLEELQSHVDYLTRELTRQTKRSKRRMEAAFLHIDTLRDDVGLLAEHNNVKFYTQPERPPRRILVSTDDA